jgi:hypothetical protein
MGVVDSKLIGDAWSSPPFLCREARPETTPQTIE